MELMLCVGAKRTKITVDDESTVRSLMELVFENTKINIVNQKLIYKGVEISKNSDQKLKDLKVKNSGKIMVIGKRYDEEEEMLLKKFEKIDSAVEKTRKTIEEIKTHAKSIMNGFIQENLKEKSRDDIRKNVLSNSALLMKNLETIDGLIVDTKFTDAKRQRKTLVDKIQVYMDFCDEINEIIDS